MVEQLSFSVQTSILPVGLHVCLDVPLCDVYKAVREKVERERPELVNKMTATLGLVFQSCIDLD